MSKVAKSGKMRGLQDRHLRMRHALIRVKLQANTNGFMNEGVVSKETVVLRRWGSSIQNLVLSTELIM